MTRTGRYQRCVTALAPVAIFVTAVIATPAAQAQTYTVLHSFKGPPTDGAGPYGNLIVGSAGNVYGTTVNGGGGTQCDGGCGVVSKLDKTRTETVLYSFTGGSDGSHPYAGLIRDSAGNLYGTTSEGGASGFGAMFKLDTAGTETVLCSFTGADGADPEAGLIRDAAGNLYGTTAVGGGSGGGVVFKLDMTGTETVLHRFTGGADGAGPAGGLIGDSAGNLYGMTGHGGIVSGVCADGCGVVFKLDKTRTETVLYSFTGGADGAGPVGDLIRDAAGNLYGITAAGGASGYGVVFKLDTTGTETVLYSFTGGADGGGPAGGLVQDSAGNLYGTTALGAECPGCGVVFKLQP